MKNSYRAYFVDAYIFKYRWKVVIMFHSYHTDRNPISDMNHISNDMFWGSMQVDIGTYLLFY